jgi:hypothetical protein
MTSRYKMLQFVLLSAGPQIHQKRVARLRSVRNVDSFTTIMEATFGRDLHPHRRFWVLFLYCGVPKGGYYLNKWQRTVEKLQYE